MEEMEFIYSYCHYFKEKFGSKITFFFMTSRKQVVTSQM